MNNNIIERNERLQKVSQALPELPTNTLIVNDYTQALSEVKGTHWSIFSRGKTQGTVMPPLSVKSDAVEREGYDAVVIRLSTNKDQMRMMLSMVNAVVKPETPIWVVGGNDEGIKSFPNTAEGYLDEVETVDVRQRSRLLKGISTGKTATFDEWKQIEDIELDGQTIDWLGVPGVFAKAHLDIGTQFLLEVLKNYSFKRTHLMADFACGTGVIARWLTDTYPEAQVDALDADSWAIELTKHNAPKANVMLSDGWTSMPRDCRYDVIVSNPPVHVGKEQDFTVLTSLLKDAQPRLHYRGQILMVAQHHIPVQRLAEETGYKICEVVEINKGYKVWRVAMHN